jgi:tRNA-Thr(GGU) m(6)t(6)A37 methyltransferase TsaA
MPLDLLDDVLLLDFTFEAPQCTLQGFPVLDMDFSQSKFTCLSKLQNSSIVNGMTLVPIGVVRSPVKSAVDDVWGGVVSTIELDAGVLGSDAAAGLDQFSHIDIIFHFHLVSASDVETGARHPRNRVDWPLAGILAQRAKRRINRLGLSTCRLVRVDGLRLTVLDLDAIDGTPVIDVKPYMTEFGPKGEIRQPSWSRELMSAYFGAFNAPDASNF